MEKERKISSLKRYLIGFFSNSTKFEFIKLYKSFLSIKFKSNNVLSVSGTLHFMNDLTNFQKASTKNMIEIIINVILPNDIRSLYSILNIKYRIKLNRFLNGKKKFITNIVYNNTKKLKT